MDSENYQKAESIFLLSSTLKVTSCQCVSSLKCVGGKERSWELLFYKYSALIILYHLYIPNKFIILHIRVLWLLAPNGLAEAKYSTSLATRAWGILELGMKML